MRTVASSFLTLAACTFAYAQGVTYSLGTESAVLDAAYYAGEAIDGSDVAGRQVLFFAPSHDGLTIAFTAVRNDNSQNAIFLVDVGDPSSWRRLTTDSSFAASALYWTPDQSHIIWGADRVNVTTGVVNTSFSVHGNQSNDRSITNLPSDNWMVSSFASNGSLRDLVVLPVLRDGSQDLSRARIQITDLQLDTSVEDFSWPSISPDGKQLTFSRYVHQTPVLTMPDISDVYALPELDKIIDAAKSIPKPIPPLSVSPLAPTSFTDPAFVEIRVSDSPNFAHCMRYSQDTSLIFVCEDFNNIFNDGNFFPSIAAGDWDIVVAKADGSGADFQIMEPGSEGDLVPFSGGTRMLYVREISSILNLFINTLEITTSVSGTPMGVPIDNIIETTTDQTVSDASGTDVFVPSGTTIDFPDGAAQEITISTPIDPVDEPQLPDTAFVDAIPVVREFGPTGTTFSPPIEITIAYIDAEVEGLDELMLTPYLFNEATGVFDTPVPESDIILRDSVNNIVVFRVDHFSIYGLAAVSAASVPAMNPIGLLLLAMLAGGFGAFALRRIARA